MAYYLPLILKKWTPVMKLTNTTFGVKTVACIAFGLLIAQSSQVLANNCSMQQIDKYLDRGFSHQQVVTMCASSSESIQEQIQVEVQKQVQEQVQVQVEEKVEQQVSQQVRQQIQQASDLPVSGSHDQLYFATVLKGTPVNLEEDSLSYETRECAVYGEIDITEMRDKACLPTRITIYFNDLKVISAQKGIPLLRKQQLIVKGTIKREYLDTSYLDKYKMIEVKKQLSLSMSSFNIPVKSGINPNDVVARLNRFIN